MKKMNIFEVNGVWQLGRPEDEHEQEYEDIPLPQEHVVGGHPQLETPMIRQCYHKFGGNSKYTGKYQHYQYTFRSN